MPNASNTSGLSPPTIGRSRPTRRASEAFQSNRLATQRKANGLKLGEKRVKFVELCFARAGQLASRDVDDLIGIAEVRCAHVFRIGIAA